MNPDYFRRAVQNRTARVSVGASAARGKDNRGVVPVARRALRRTHLAGLGTNNPTRFRSALDRKTKRLIQTLPRPARRWGLARKILNIYLRDCLYNQYLSRAFHLDRAEFLYEVPLDSITASGLKRAAGRGNLPRWPGVRKLTAPVSEKFQQFALELAQRKEIARVHLDALYWSVGRDE
jgi:hypothetical protein